MNVMDFALLMADANGQARNENRLLLPFRFQSLQQEPPKNPFLLLSCFTKDAGLLQPRAFSILQSDHIFRLGPPLAGSHLKADPLALVQGFIPFRLDGGEMDENVLAGVGCNKTVALLRAEPFYCSCRAHIARLQIKYYTAGPKEDRMKKTHTSANHRAINDLQKYVKISPTLELQV